MLQETRYDHIRGEFERSRLFIIVENRVYSRSYDALIYVMNQDFLRLDNVMVRKGPIFLVEKILSTEAHSTTVMGLNLSPCSMERLCLLE